MWDNSCNTNTALINPNFWVVLSERACNNSHIYLFLQCKDQCNEGSPDQHRITSRSRSYNGLQWKWNRSTICSNQKSYVIYDRVLRNFCVSETKYPGSWHKNYTCNTCSHEYNNVNVSFLICDFTS